MCRERIHGFLVGVWACQRARRHTGNRRRYRRWQGAVQRRTHARVVGMALLQRARATSRRRSALWLALTLLLLLQARADVVNETEASGFASTGGTGGLVYDAATSTLYTSSANGLAVTAYNASLVAQSTWARGLSTNGVFSERNSYPGTTVAGTFALNRYLYVCDSCGPIGCTASNCTCAVAGSPATYQAACTTFNMDTGVRNDATIQFAQGTSLLTLGFVINSTIATYLYTDNVHSLTGLGVEYVSGNGILPNSTQRYQYTLSPVSGATRSDMLYANLLAGTVSVLFSAYIPATNKLVYYSVAHNVPSPSDTPCLYGIGLTYAYDELYVRTIQMSAIGPSGTLSNGGQVNLTISPSATVFLSSVAFFNSVQDPLMNTTAWQYSVRSIVSSGTWLLVTFSTVYAESLPCNDASLDPHSLIYRVSSTVTTAPLTASPTDYAYIFNARLLSVALVTGIGSSNTSVLFGVDDANVLHKYAVTVSGASLTATEFDTATNGTLGGSAINGTGYTYTIAYASPANNALYLAVASPQASSSVIRVPFAACGNATTCGGCLAMANPFCGWCALQAACTFQSDCASSALAGAWIESSGGSCPVITSTTALGQVIAAGDVGINGTFTMSGLPNITTLSPSTYTCTITSATLGSVTVAATSAGVAGAYVCTGPTLTGPLVGGTHETVRVAPSYAGTILAGDLIEYTVVDCEAQPATCTNCLGAGYSVCGFCTLQNACTSAAQCTLAGYQNGFATVLANCPAPSSPAPGAIPTGAATNITVAVTGLPTPQATPTGTYVLQFVLAGATVQAPWTGAYTYASGVLSLTLTVPSLPVGTLAGNASTEVVPASLYYNSTTASSFNVLGGATVNLTLYDCGSAGATCQVTCRRWGVRGTAPLDRMAPGPRPSAQLTPREGHGVGQGVARAPPPPETHRTAPGQHCTRVRGVCTATRAWPRPADRGRRCGTPTSAATACSFRACLRPR